MYGFVFCLLGLLLFCSLVSLYADPKKKRHVANVARDAAKGYVQLVWHKKYCLQLWGVRMNEAMLGGGKNTFFGSTKVTAKSLGKNC